MSLVVAAGKAAVIRRAEWVRKDTLLRVIAGLELPDTGEVVLNGNTVSTAGRTIVPPHQRRLRFVFRPKMNHLGAANLLIGARKPTVV